MTGYTGPTGTTGPTGPNLWTQIGNDIYNNNLTGNVGIGTITPVFVLDVSGNSRFSDIIYSQGGITGTNGSFAKNSGFAISRNPVVG